MKDAAGQREGEWGNGSARNGVTSTGVEEAERKLHCCRGLTAHPTEERCLAAAAELAL